MTDQRENDSSSYLPFLPSCFQESSDKGRQSFFQEYLKIFERIWHGREDDALREHLFSAPEANYHTALDNKEVPAALHKLFAQGGNSLPEKPTVVVEQQGRQWVVVVGSFQYWLIREKKQIHGYLQGRRGLDEMLDVIGDFFHPRFSFAFSETEEEFLPPLTGEAEREFSRYFSPGTMFYEWLEEYLLWMADWLALTLYKQWPLAKKREVIARIIPLYRMRGTKKGLEEYLKIYSGGGVTIRERIDSFQVGVHSQVEDEVPVEGIPYFFSVTLLLPALDAATMRQKIQSVKQIIEMEKPAHTRYKLNIKIVESFQIESHSTVGVDTILGE